MTKDAKCMILTYHRTLRNFYVNFFLLGFEPRTFGFVRPMHATKEGRDITSKITIFKPDFDAKDNCNILEYESTKLWHAAFTPHTRTSVETWSRVCTTRLRAIPCPVVSSANNWSFLTCANKINMCHGNNKDCVIFSRLCLELVTMQKHDLKETCRHKKMTMWKYLNY